MRLLKNLSIRNKLVLLLVLPLAGLLFFQQRSIVTELSRQNLNKQHQNELSRVKIISSVVDALQKESNLSEIFSSTNQPIDKNELLKQQALTDKTIDELHKNYQTNNVPGKDVVPVTDLAAMRNPTHHFSRNAHEINLELIKEINRNYQAAEDPGIKHHLQALLTIVYAKEFLTVIRNIFIRAKGDLSLEHVKTFTLSKGKYEFNLQSFKNIASAELVGYYETTVGETPAYINSRLDSLFKSSGPAVANSSKEMLLTDLSKINGALKKVEDFTLQTIHENLAANFQDIQQNLIRKIVLTVAVFLLIVLIAGIMIKAIVNSVEDIKDATERIMKGDIDFELNVESSDELGELAVSFNKMVAVFQDYIHIANSIGRGDYKTEIKLKNDKDLLGRAFISMRDNLYHLSNEKDRQTWLLSGNNELNQKLREEKDLRNLAQDILTQVTTFLKAQVGALYLAENDILTRVGCYALDPKSAPDSFEIGQSLVGQAALEKKPIIFDSVPENYLKITSSLGSVTPSTIIVFPFLYVGKVKGVIELGAARTFTSSDVEFLQLVGNSISIAFNSSQSRSKLRDLLDETQRQAEELESQQEELRQFNDELLEKIDSIEKSEAELKVQQEELQRSNAELEEAASLLENEKQILEKAKAIVEAKAQNLESVSKYKSEFLANMSHELRTPLNSILILTQLLIENKNGSLNEKELKYANVIYNSGNELLTLINDILDLSKVESGKMEVSLDDIPISVIVSDISAMFSQVAKSKSINFKINATEVSETIILTDKQRLEQILRNLLSNAFKFTPSQGSVTLLIESSKAKKTNLKKLRDVNELITFSVIDTGIGIQKDKQEVIFEAFRQVDSTDKRKYGGTGLGLSICRELSTLLGGEITLKSEEGKGSIFTLHLPVTYRPENEFNYQLPLVEETETKRIEDVLKEQEEIVDDDRTNVKPTDRTILILEDDKEFAQAMLAFVRERNYKGIIAHQGNTGVSFARHYKPDAILLDMKLPVMSGEEVLQQLKNDPHLRHIPIQIISGFSRKKEALKLGAFDFIKKPVTKDDLQKVFERLEEFTNRKYKRLLVVENDSAESKAMCELIGNGDVECFSAVSGKDAYEKLNESRYDCMIIDFELSDVSVIDFLEQIKTNNQLNKIPIIVYSSRDLTDEQNKKLGALANSIVLKTASSYERLLDETTLFLHRMEANMPKDKQHIIRKLHRSDEVLKKKTVLIVDDDIRNIYSLTSALEDEEMQCLTAANGKEALEVVNKSEAVHIILMDVMMPEMDGYEATLEIRKIRKLSKIPIIALTAKAMKGDREKCLAVGMSDYITKPVDIGQLLSLMRVWLYNG